MPKCQQIGKEVQLMSNPHVIHVIESFVCRGSGGLDDPTRTVRQYHTLRGEFLAEFDGVDTALCASTLVPAVDPEPTEDE
mgnify:CR=1 FL=1